MNINIIKNESVRQQIKINFFIVMILDIIFYIAISFFGKWGLATFWGIFLGSGYGVLNLIFISVGMERLIFVEKEKLKTTAFLYYMIRYLLMAFFVLLVIKLSRVVKIDVVFFLITLFFSKNSKNLKNLKIHQKSKKNSKKLKKTLKNSKKTQKNSKCETPYKIDLLYKNLM